jgi:hypothetical protein
MAHRGLPGLVATEVTSFQSLASLGEFANNWQSLGMWFALLKSGITSRKQQIHDEGGRYEDQDERESRNQDHVKGDKGDRQDRDQMTDGGRKP